MFPAAENDTRRFTKLTSIVFTKYVEIVYVFELYTHQVEHFPREKLNLNSYRYTSVQKAKKTVELHTCDQSVRIQNFE